MSNYEIITRNTNFNITEIISWIISSKINILLLILFISLILHLTYADVYDIRFRNQKLLLIKIYLSIKEIFRRRFLENDVLYLYRYKMWLLYCVILYPIYVSFWYIAISHMDYFYNLRFVEVYMRMDLHPTRKEFGKYIMRKFCRTAELRWHCLGWEADVAFWISDKMIYFGIYLFIVWNFYYLITTIFYEVEAIVDISRYTIVLLLCIICAYNVATEMQTIKHYLRFLWMANHSSFALITGPWWILGANAMEDLSDEDEEIDFYNVTEERDNEFNLTDIDDSFGGSEITAIFWNSAESMDSIVGNIWRYTDIYRWLFSSENYRRGMRLIDRIQPSLVTAIYIKNYKLDYSGARRIFYQKYSKDISSLHFPRNCIDIRLSSIEFRKQMLEDGWLLRVLTPIWEFFFLGAIRLYRLFKRQTFTYFNFEENIIVSFFVKYNAHYNIGGGNITPATEFDDEMWINRESRDFPTGLEGWNRAFIHARVRERTVDYSDVDYAEIPNDHPTNIAKLYIRRLQVMRYDEYCRYTFQGHNLAITYSRDIAFDMLWLGGHLNKCVYLNKDKIIIKFSYIRIREVEAFFHPMYVFLYTMIDEKYESLTTHELYHRKFQLLDAVRKDHLFNLRRTFCVLEQEDDLIEEYFADDDYSYSKADQVYGVYRQNIQDGISRIKYWVYQDKFKDYMSDLFPHLIFRKPENIYLHRIKHLESPFMAKGKFLYKKSSRYTMGEYEYIMNSLIINFYKEIFKRVVSNFFWYKISANIVNSNKIDYLYNDMKEFYLIKELVTKSNLKAHIFDSWFFYNFGIHWKKRVKRLKLFPKRQLTKLKNLPKFLSKHKDILSRNYSFFSWSRISEKSINLLLLILKKIIVGGFNKVKSILNLSKRLIIFLYTLIYNLYRLISTITKYVIFFYRPILLNIKKEFKHCFYLFKNDNWMASHVTLYHFGLQDKQIDIDHLQIRWEARWRIIAVDVLFSIVRFLREVYRRFLEWRILDRFAPIYIYKIVSNLKKFLSNHSDFYILKKLVPISIKSVHPLERNPAYSSSKILTLRLKYKDYTYRKSLKKKEKEIYTKWDNTFHLGDLEKRKWFSWSRHYWFQYRPFVKPMNYSWFLLGKMNISTFFFIWLLFSNKKYKFVDRDWRSSYLIKKHLRFKKRKKSIREKRYLFLKLSTLKKSRDYYNLYMLYDTLDEEILAERQKFINKRIKYEQDKETSLYGEHYIDGELRDWHLQERNLPDIEDRIRK